MGENQAYQNSEFYTGKYDPKTWDKWYYLNNKLKWGKDKEKRRVYARIYYKLNHQKTIQYRRNQRINLIKFLGDFCKHCGYNVDIRGLQIDHINGKGTEEAERKFTNNFSMYRFYLKNPELAKRNLQTLCANCNAIKRYTNGERCYG